MVIGGRELVVGKIDIIKGWFNVFLGFVLFLCLELDLWLRLDFEVFDNI